MMTDADLPPPETTRLLETLADQAAVAIERLRSVVLSSLSHYLRTPLVSII